MGLFASHGTIHGEIRRGVWVPLRALATQPVLRDLSVRYGQSSGDPAYPCRIGVGAEAGYSDPRFLVVSAGLRKATGPARLITAATGQRFTTKECFRDGKNVLYEGAKGKKMSRRVSLWMRSILAQRLDFKTPARGSRRQGVASAYTSQECSHCGDHGLR